MVERFGVYLVNLDDAPSKDAKNTRPCVVLSPDEMNRNIGHVIIAPISATGRPYPTRIAVDLLNTGRSVVLDQLRTVDRERLVKKIGELETADGVKVLKCLAEMFAE